MNATRQSQSASMPEWSDSLPPGVSGQIENLIPSHDMVAQRAFEIWLRHGCPEGTEFQDWLAAEAELRSRR